ncbi:hypothetical protein [Methylocapsa palsarum]|uniref:Uncharacterized protein n=1 Tax=Methylocapsa palsarum TaxID=1612308 RepID=A0A1I4AJE3_9HYPH|nr:hypothetical protein [Methylocapsa palsarum]SFK56300.1 hypothetical protein SAMN05444581_110132 [Methylocapsa palsarum]
MKKTSLCAALTLCASPAFAADQPLTCHYDGHGDLTSSEAAPAGATVGSVERNGWFGDGYIYVISAKDGSACPGQVPLGTKTALTAPIVRQPTLNCGTSASAGDGAVLGGSVTVFHAPAKAIAVTVRMNGGTTPNTKYKFSVNCEHVLGSLQTDAQGNGDARFSFVESEVGPSFALGLAADEPAGNIFQSVPLTLK